MNQKKAIIIGASSGIGKELAKILSNNNYIVGLVSRRIELLIELQNELPNKSFIKQIDVTKFEDAEIKIKELINEMGKIDLVIISTAIVDYANSKFNWTLEHNVIDTNVLGFTLTSCIFMKHFIENGFGHLVGLSSITAIRGTRKAHCYAATKAFVCNYLEGLRLFAIRTKKPIYVTNCMTGYVDTPIIKTNPKDLFWVSTVQKASNQIYNAIVKKKQYAYITKRWRFYAWYKKIIPNWFLNWYFSK